MKVELYEAMMRTGGPRRRLLPRAAAIGAAAALLVGVLPAAAQDDVRAEILKIPGVGMGSPPMPTGRRSARCASAPPRRTSPRASSRASS